MRRCNVALGFMLALFSGTFFAPLDANEQNTAPGTPVHVVVTVESRHGAKLPEITREDVVVTEGHDRERVTEWLPPIGGTLAPLPLSFLGVQHLPCRRTPH